MIKILIRGIILALTVAVATTAAAAAEVYREQGDAIGVSGVEDAAPGESRELMGGMSVYSADFESGLGRIFAGAGARLRGVVSGALASAAAIIMAAAFSGIFAAAFPEPKQNYAALAGVLAVSVISLTSVNAFIGLSARVLDELALFSRMLLPALTAAASASGAFTSAAVRYAATALFLEILGTAARTVVMPLIYAFCALSIAEAAVGGETLSGASGLIKWLVKSLLSVYVIAFLLYMALVGIIASTADSVAVRAAKVTISTVLPVVGSILADAADTVLSGAMILRNAVGIFGVLTVTAVCAVPFMRIGAHYLLFKAAGGLSGAIADSRVTKLINNFGAAFGMTLGLAGINAVTLFVSIISVIRTVT